MDKPTQEEARQEAREVLGMTSPAEFMEQFPRIWRLLLGEPPSNYQVLVWLRQHSPERLIEALAKTARKAERMRDANHEMSPDRLVRFFSSVANTIKSEFEEETKMETQTTGRKNPLPRLDDKYKTAPKPAPEPAPLTPSQYKEDSDVSK